MKINIILKRLDKHFCNFSCHIMVLIIPPDLNKKLTINDITWLYRNTERVTRDEEIRNTTNKGTAKSHQIF